MENTQPIRQLSNQEILNIVWERAKDKRKALQVVAHLQDLCGCRFRANVEGEVLACFVGACIPNSLYVPKMDDCDLHELITRYPQLGFVPGQYKFLKDLQSVHDFRNVEEWEELLRNTANGYGLTIPD